MKNIPSLDEHSGMITSYSVKIKDVIVSFINFLEKLANSNLLVIQNIYTLKSLLITLAPCSSPVMVLRLQLILILENQWSQNLLALLWSANLKLLPRDISTSCIRTSYLNHLWSSGLGNYFLCKIFAVETALWSLKLNLEHNIITEIIANLNDFCIQKFNRILF